MGMGARGPGFNSRLRQRILCLIFVTFLPQNTYFAILIHLGYSTIARFVTDYKGIKTDRQTDRTFIQTCTKYII